MFTITSATSLAPMVADSQYSNYTDLNNGSLTNHHRNLTSNQSENDDEDDDVSAFYKNILTIIFYSLIIFVSLCGNILVLRLITKRKKLQTTTNILIASLAFSDILTTTLNVPFNVARFVLMNYPFGALFCKLVPFIQVCCVYVSTLTMGVIAIHRHITLSCPHRAIHISSGNNTSSKRVNPSGDNCRLGIIMAFVWLISAVLAIPHSMFNHLAQVEYKHVNYTRCRADFPQFGFNFPFWLSVEAFLTQYLIPLSITCTLYIKIGFIVSKQGRIASKANNRRKKEQDDARRRRITMLALVVLVFALCWFPLNLYHILVDFHIIHARFSIFLVCHWIAMSSVCYNPFIYCWLNESFRKGAFKMLSLVCFCCPQSFGLAAQRTNTSRHNSNQLMPPGANDNNGAVENTINLSETNLTMLVTNDNMTNHCKKSKYQVAVNSKKERRKFPKLRPSSFRKHHQHSAQQPKESDESQNRKSNESNRSDQTAETVVTVTVCSSADCSISSNDSNHKLDCQILKEPEQCDSPQNNNISVCAVSNGNGVDRPTNASSTIAKDETDNNA